MDLILSYLYPIFNIKGGGGYLPLSLYHKNMKTCTICKIEKESSNFRKDKQKRDGLRSSCKLCEKDKYNKNKEYHRKRTREYYSKNSEICRDKSREWRKNNPEKVKAQKKRNYEKHKEHYKQYKKEYHKNRWENDEQYRINSRQNCHNRRKALKQATPEWSDSLEISKIYERARDISIKTGVQMHVDHIIPLRGENVCGLHIAENLQILTAEDNITKSNKLI